MSTEKELLSRFTSQIGFWNASLLVCASQSAPWPTRLARCSSCDWPWLAVSPPSTEDSPNCSSGPPSAACCGPQYANSTCLGVYSNCKAVHIFIFPVCTCPRLFSHPPCWKTPKIAQGRPMGRCVVVWPFSLPHGGCGTYFHQGKGYNSIYLRHCSYSVLISWLNGPLQERISFLLCSVISLVLSTRAENHTVFPTQRPSSRPSSSVHLIMLLRRLKYTPLGLVPLPK